MKLLIFGLALALASHSAIHTQSRLSSDTIKKFLQNSQLPATDKDIGVFSLLMSTYLKLTDSCSKLLSQRSTATDQQLTSIDKQIADLQNITRTFAQQFDKEYGPQWREISPSLSFICERPLPSIPVSGPSTSGALGQDLKAVLDVLGVDNAQDAIFQISALLKSLDAQNLEQAAEQISNALDNQQDQLIKVITSIYTTTANALNSKEIEAKIKSAANALKQDEPAALNQIKQLNQELYNQIHGLKDSWFESLQALKFAESLIKQLKLIIDANNRGASDQELKALIPAQLPEMPKALSLQEIPR